MKPKPKLKIMPKTNIEDEQITQIIARMEEIEAKMAQSDPSSPDYALVAKDYARSAPLADLARQIQKTRAEQNSLEELAQGADEDMARLARDDMPSISKKIDDLENDFITHIQNQEEAHLGDQLILEIRAGTGGEEASLFASDLLRMYQRYSATRAWQWQILSLTPSPVGGIKEAIIEIKGEKSVSRLNLESGVHRVQRVPITESSGRIHTSAATIAILPEPEEYEVNIDPSDLRIEVFRARGPGGQSVNTTDSAVRITHLPSQIVVSQQDEKSQHKNRARALKVLRARLYEFEQNKINEERARNRKTQIGSGDRSQRVRTYNFPQGRITDHRLGLTIHALDKVLEGEGLDLLIDPLLQWQRERNISALGDL